MQGWNELYHSGNFANGTTAQYIRGDGSLATYKDTTYSEITTAQTVSASSSAVRLITGRRLKYAFDNITAANATSSSKLTGNGGITTLPGTSNLLYTGRISSSALGSMPYSSNANGIITMNTHSGNYH